jgi:Tfp pilus assembly protein PilN
MTRINLLPPEIKEKVTRPNYALWFIPMAVVVIALLALGFLYFNAQKAGKQDTLNGRRAELEEKKKTVEEPMKVFEEQEAKLKSLQNLYKAANAGRVAWASMLNDLAIYVPEGLATASNPRAPAIWLTELSIDATPLEVAGGAPAAMTAGATTSIPITIKGYAAPAWLSIQTWIARASEFAAKGFLDAYPYYYYFRGQPRVAEFFVRLHNMEEWTDLWIESSTQEAITVTRTVLQPGATEPTEETYQDWAVRFTINAYWNPDQAIWEKKSAAQAEGGKS